MLYHVIGILLVSWGRITTTVRTQTEKPQRLRDSSLINDPAADQLYPDALQYCLAVVGQNYTLQLDENKDFIGNNLSVTHHYDQGNQATTFRHLRGYCYNHGHMEDVEGSTASMTLCCGTEDEGLHAVYKHSSLRHHVKRTPCSHVYMSLSFDNVAPLPGQLKPSLKSSVQTLHPTLRARTVELVLVVDHSEYKKFNSTKTVETRMIQVANHVDKLYRRVGVRVMLVGLDIWSKGDEIVVSTDATLTITRFLLWRQRILMLRIKHDNAQFVTDVVFEGDILGLASLGKMCTSQSGGINRDYSTNPMGLASVIAHEMGHNLGLIHDTENCVCSSTIWRRTCIMANKIGHLYPTSFSTCSKDQLRRFFKDVDPPCLLDAPSTDRIYGGPVCGNAFVESEEECDCGTPQECRNPCCSASTCKLKAGAQCAEGECCQKCNLKPAGSVCRLRTGDCDVTEYCTGLSDNCPTDAYAQNGLVCDGGNGYCYNGQCPSRLQHCKRLWGPDAEVADDMCFYYANCHRWIFWACPRRDLLCRTLICSRGWDSPVVSNQSTFRLHDGKVCKEAIISPEDNYPDNFTMVPTGSKCGNNMACFDQRCEKIASVNCSAKCNDRGVCNQDGECHCEPGWAPPFCDERQPEPSQKSPTFITILAVSSALLSALIVGSVVCYVKKAPLAQRCLQLISGSKNQMS